MHRFFVPPDILKTYPVLFPPETAHQISAVLRLERGQDVILLDNTGVEFQVELMEVGNKVVLGRIVETRSSIAEPAVQVVLYLSLTQREKFEWALQKCTEVGVTGFLPVITRRSLVQTMVEARNKYERWGKILQEAAEQSGRGLVPTLYEPLRFGQALAHARQNAEVTLIPWENEHNATLHSALFQAGDAPHVAVFIGPEGGFSAEEVTLACQTGALPVTLGRRILRMETAAVVSAALVLDFFENQLK